MIHAMHHMNNDFLTPSNSISYLDKTTMSLQTDYREDIDLKEEYRTTGLACFGPYQFEVNKEHITENALRYENGLAQANCILRKGEIYK